MNRNYVQIFCSSINKIRIEIVKQNIYSLSIHQKKRWLNLARRKKEGGRQVNCLGGKESLKLVFVLVG
jgi:hypothetical protein